MRSTVLFALRMAFIMMIVIPTAYALAEWLVNSTWVTRSIIFGIIGLVLVYRIDKGQK